MILALLVVGIVLGAIGAFVESFQRAERGELSKS